GGRAHEAAPAAGAVPATTVPRAEQAPVGPGPNSEGKVAHSFGPPVISSQRLEAQRRFPAPSPASPGARSRHLRQARNAVLNERLARHIAAVSATGPGDLSGADADLAQLRRLHAFREGDARSSSSEQRPLAPSRP